MSAQTPLTPENFREVFEIQAIRQHGFVKRYSYWFISDPQNVIPITTKTEAMLYLQLDIEPDENSDIAVLFIRFEPEQASYAPVRYGNQNGNASKPISHYPAMMDLLRAADTSGKRVQVFLSINPDGRNSVVLI